MERYIKKMTADELSLRVTQLQRKLYAVSRRQDTNAIESDVTDRRMDRILQEIGEINMELSRRG